MEMEKAEGTAEVWMRMRKKIEEAIKKTGGRKADGSAGNDTRFFTCYSITYNSSAALLLYTILHAIVAL